MNAHSNLNTRPGFLAHSRLVSFLAWWQEELAALVPTAAHGMLLSGQKRVLLEVAGDEVCLSRVSGHKRVPVGRYHLETHDAAGPRTPPVGARAREVVLCLARDQVLVKQVTLPAATEENLRETLAYEMERLTPFQAEQVYYDFRVISRDNEQRHIVVTFSLAQRNLIDGLLSRLKHGPGLEPDRVTHACDAAGEYAPLNLLPVQHRPRLSILQRRINRALGVLALLLLAVVVALPVVEKKQTIRMLQFQLDAVAQEARAAQRLRDTVDHLKAQSRFLADSKQRSLLVLQLVDELTQLLPDDTWISQLDIKDREIQLRGNSAASAALIAALEASPLLRNARFRSPVTRDRRIGTERFHLSAEIGREPVP